MSLLIYLFALGYIINIKPAKHTTHTYSMALNRLSNSNSLTQIVLFWMPLLKCVKNLNYAAVKCFPTTHTHPLKSKHAVFSVPRFITWPRSPKIKQHKQDQMGIHRTASQNSALTIRLNTAGLLRWIHTCQFVSSWCTRWFQSPIRKSSPRQTDCPESSHS